MAEAGRKNKTKGAAAESVDEFETDRELAALAKALGHPLRVRIVRLLAQRKTCVCGELVEELPVAQSTASQHLKILKQAGVIRGTIDGPRVCYCVEPAVLQRLRVLVDALPKPEMETELERGRC